MCRETKRLRLQSGTMMTWKCYHELDTWFIDVDNNTDKEISEIYSLLEFANLYKVEIIASKLVGENFTSARMTTIDGKFALRISGIGHL